MYDQENTNQIANVRLVLDEKLKLMGKTKFFISCISGTSTNSGDGDGESRPCIAYFIIYDSKLTSEEEIFATFHDNDLDPQLKKISGYSKEPKPKSTIFKELKKALKVRCFSFFNKLFCMFRFDLRLCSRVKSYLNSHEVFFIPLHLDFQK